MVFTTGNSLGHLRKMGDTLVDAMKLRKLDKFNPTVEGRNSPNWMIVDCSDIIVQLFSASILFYFIGAREVYQLEDHWEGMRVGKDRYLDDESIYDEETLEKLVSKYALNDDFFKLLDDIPNNDNNKSKNKNKKK